MLWREFRFLFRLFLTIFLLRYSVNNEFRCKLSTDYIIIFLFSFKDYLWRDAAPDEYLFAVAFIMA